MSRKLSGRHIQQRKRLMRLKVTQVPGYEPVVLIDRHVARYEKSAYYAMADCCMVNAVRDGMNLVPYKYVVCRQGSSGIIQAEGADENSPRTSMLVVSEFIGCSNSLSGAIRVNPWDTESVAEAMTVAIYMSESEKQLRHKKNYRYVYSSHHVGYWARSFMQDLERASKDHCSNRCWGISLGVSFRVIALSPSFRKLFVDYIASSYKRTSRRAIFLDYDGTVNEPAVVKRDQHIVEVKPQGVTKGSVAQKVLSTLMNSGSSPDFVMCIRDDRSDEDIFESITSIASSPSLPSTPKIFACTVGQKPTKVKYYLDDTTDVPRLLLGLWHTTSLTVAFNGAF